jgi:hypothetical protein
MWWTQWLLNRLSLPVDSYSVYIFFLLSLKQTIHSHLAKTSNLVFPEVMQLAYFTYRSFFILLLQTAFLLVVILVTKMNSRWR